MRRASAVWAVFGLADSQELAGESRGRMEGKMEVFVFDGSRRVKTVLNVGIRGRVLRL